MLLPAGIAGLKHKWERHTFDVPSQSSCVLSYQLAEKKARKTWKIVINLSNNIILIRLGSRERWEMRQTGGGGRKFCEGVV
ncbi:hypothetical protein D3Z55_08105 [Clostridiaceae bacterium]|nr:hypothetical protein [Clostridiaceae bacterium]